MKAFVKCLIVLSLGLGGAVSVNAQTAPPTVPTVTIKIYNEDLHHTIYPTYSTGHHLPTDKWMQAIFKLPQALNDTDTYQNLLTYRIWVNPSTGIPPGKSAILTIPLYTPLFPTPDPTQPDQYIDWWNGVNIWMFYGDYNSSTPPTALTYELATRPQTPINPQNLPSGAVVPTCETDVHAPCDQLLFFSDTAGEFVPANPTALFEFTLGARNQLPVVNPQTDPTNTLDLLNVDFDLSFVDAVFGPGAMGTYQNDQVGYVGTPSQLGNTTTKDTFQYGLQQFKNDFAGWPQFVKTYDQTKCPTCPASEIFLKFPSLLNIFNRLSGVNAPADLTPPPHWPDKLWTPVQLMFDDWIAFAGHVGKTDGQCKNVYSTNNFCGAILRVKKLIQDNYDNYLKLSCGSPKIKLTDQVMIAKVYGWQSFQENGCAADANTLPNTPGYWTWVNQKDNVKDYKKYNDVKLGFDQLNYQLFTDKPQYNFNPWVQLIHNPKYLGVTNAYAYSVDDAVGNIQAFGGGIIIDVGGTTHLENPNEAGPLVTVTLGSNPPNNPLNWATVRICKNEPSRERRINPLFTGFDLDINTAQSCPIFALDTKVPPQIYTFRIKVPPKQFPEIDNPPDQKPTQQTGPALIDCSGNASVASSTPSSALWCCEKLAGGAVAGVWGWKQQNPDALAHQQTQYKVGTGPPMVTTTIPMGRTVCP